MVDETTETIVFVSGMEDDPAVLPLAYQLLDVDDDPITGTLTQAEFRVFEGSRRKLRLTLEDDRLEWDSDTASLTGEVLNSDVTFIRDDIEYTYAVFVVVDDVTHMIAKGPLESERVD